MGKADTARSMGTHVGTATAHLPRVSIDASKYLCLQNNFCYRIAIENLPELAQLLHTICISDTQSVLLVQVTNPALNSQNFHLYITLCI